MIRNRLPWIICFVCIVTSAILLYFYQGRYIPPISTNFPSDFQTIIDRITKLESKMTASVDVCPEVKAAIEILSSEVRLIGKESNNMLRTSIVRTPAIACQRDSMEKVVITGKGFLVTTNVDPLHLTGVFSIIPVSIPGNYFLFLKSNQGYFEFMRPTVDECDKNCLLEMGVSHENVTFTGNTCTTKGSKLENIQKVLNNIIYFAPQFPSFGNDYNSLQAEIWSNVGNSCTVVSTFSVVVKVLREMYKPPPKSIRPNTLPEHANKPPPSLETDVTIVIKTMDRYPKLVKLLSSIRRYYKTIPIVVADDSKKKKVIRRTDADGRELKPGSSHGSEVYAREVGFGSIGIQVDIIDDIWNNIRQLMLPYDSGAPAGRLAALQIVKTKYFCVLDDDHLFTDKTSLSVMYTLLESRKYDLVGGSEGTESYIAELHLANQKLKSEYPPGIEIPEMKNCFVRERTAAFFMARRSAFLRFGGWATELSVGDHTEMFVRLKGRLRVVSCPFISVDHNNKDKYEQSSEYNNLRYHRESLFRARIFWKWQAFEFEDPFKYDPSNEIHGQKSVIQFSPQDYAKHVNIHFSCSPTAEDKLNNEVSRRYSNDVDCLRELNDFAQSERESWED